jgi:hypothetical protein
VKIVAIGKETATNLGGRFIVEHKGLFAQTCFETGAHRRAVKTPLGVFHLYFIIRPSG